MRFVSFAAIQFSCSWDRDANLTKAKDFVRAAAAQGADVVLVQELFETPYFCQDQSADFFALARPFADNPVIREMAELAKTLGVVLPVSFFERAGTAYFNALAMIDADGTVLGRYRKAHIPDGPGYQEKYYFTPGDSGFQVWQTRAGILGCGICWDQWFPEAARAMALMGAEALLYPTAIGSEPPPAPPLDSRDHWRRTMQGHAAANLLPVIAANRVGTEKGLHSELTFYGSSFIAGSAGEIVAELDREEEGLIIAQFDLDLLTKMRASWGVFRDRRPDLYGILTRYDNNV